MFQKWSGILFIMMNSKNAKMKGIPNFPAKKRSFFMGFWNNLMMIMIRQFEEYRGTTLLKHNLFYSRM